MANKQKKHRHVYGVFRNRIDADLVYDTLLTKGYTDREIHVMMTEQTRDTHYANDAHDESGHPVGSQATEGMGVGAASGGVLGAAGGAVAAALATAGSIAIPGGVIGAILLAGPIAAGLAGAAAGAAAGGLVGALTGAGIPESNASAYESALTEGGIVLGVEPRENDDVDDIKDIFKENNGENVWAG